MVLRAGVEVFVTKFKMLLGKHDLHGLYGIGVVIKTVYLRHIPHTADGNDLSLVDGAVLGICAHWLKGRQLTRCGPSRVAASSGGLA